MILLTLPPSEKTGSGNRRWLDEQRWRTPLVVLFFSLVLLLVLGLLGLVAWLSLQPRLAVGPTQVAGPVGSARITVTPPMGAVGTLLRVDGQGWNPKDVVFISLEAPNDPAEQDFAYAGAVAGDDGRFVVAFTLPETEQWSRAGAIKVVAWAEQSGAKAVTIFQVTAPTVTETPAGETPGATPRIMPGVTLTVTTNVTPPLPVSLAPSPVAPRAVNWYGEYFAGAGLSGAPAFVRDDSDIDFDWGTGGPGRKIGGSDFSVRWTRQVYFTAGVYRFFARVDDGVRVWVDDKLVIDQWHVAATTTYVSDFYVLPGPHRMLVEYYNKAGAALIRVWWERQEVYPDWKAEYFSGRLPNNKADLVRNDSQILFNWNGDAPAPGIQADNFSVRWTRRAHFDQGQYRFYLRADSGMRVWLDSSLVIDLWTNAGSGLRTVNLSLSEGEYSIRVEYYNRGGTARAELRWDLIAAPPPAAPTSVQMAVRPTVAAMLVAPTATPRRPAVPAATRAATVAPTKAAPKPTATRVPTQGPTASASATAAEVAPVAPIHAQAVSPQAGQPLTTTVEIVSPEARAAEITTPEPMAAASAIASNTEVAAAPEPMATASPIATNVESAAASPSATPAETPMMMRAQSLTVAQSTPQQSVPRGKPSLAVQPARVAPGGEMTIIGQAWQAGVEVIISLVKPGEDLQSAPPFSRAIVDPQGGFVLTATLPDDPRWAGLPDLIVLAHSIDWTTRLVTPLHVITAPRPAPASP